MKSIKHRRPSAVMKSLEESKKAKEREELQARLRAVANSASTPEVGASVLLNVLAEWVINHEFDTLLTITNLCDVLRLGLEETHNHGETDDT